MHSLRKSRRLAVDPRAGARRAGLGVVTLLVAGACSGPQSALDPAGPAATAIAQIWWVMAIGATLVLALVLALFGYALLRGDRGPALRRPRLLIVWGGLVFPTVVLTALLVYGVIASRYITAHDEVPDHVIEVIGHRWHWEFVHRDAAGDVLMRSRNQLTLPRARLVEFHVSSVDVIHSFWIPRLGGKIDAIPGIVNTLRLRALGDGAIRGQCAEFCGVGHSTMSFDVDVLDAAEFDAWLSDGVDSDAEAAAP